MSRRNINLFTLTLASFWLSVVLTAIANDAGAPLWLVGVLLLVTLGVGVLTVVLVGRLLEDLEVSDV